MILLKVSSFKVRVTSQFIIQFLEHTGTALSSHGPITLESHSLRPACRAVRPRAVLCCHSVLSGGLAGNSNQVERNTNLVSRSESC
eukprot:660345-Hanusia_phi.AAC.1